MLYKKKGYPEDSEIVICTVAKVLYHAVVVTLDEYDKQGLIHISEVSPGRIRNIRDFVNEGKKCICKVLNTNPEKGHIDLSLRRVNEGQKIQKNNEIKQEQKAEKIVESLAQGLKKPVEQVYNELTEVLLKHYELLYYCFEDVVESQLDLQNLGLKQELAEPLTKLIKEKIKPKEVNIAGELSLKSYAENGIDIIRAALMEAEKVDKSVDIKYVGAGKYSLRVTAKEYKSAEDIMKKAVEKATAYVNKNGEASFSRKEI